ncbi:MAG: GtrA family protein [Prevotella sp.]|nr:GtrA family protein [Prevotella sp.]MBQ4444764.1 GtrA family protein [Prevotella sp.]MBQ6033555.1 GtrA family protein [Prevotella sp.]MBQ6309121.1 GtrA family protein [Prevotella sp.]MBQ6659083.1 GtrA family protein [Prevotella sp.]
MKISRQTIYEILRFGIVGVVATLLHYVIYWILQHWINVNVAYTIGYFLSFIANYFLSAQFTFREKTTTRNGIGFAGAHLFNYLFQMVLLNIFLWLGVSKALAPLPVYCIAVPVNFILVRTVFKKLS